MKNLMSILIFIVLFSNCAFSQEVEYFINLANETNPGLESIRMNYRAAKLKANQVDDYPDPMVSLGIGLSPVETRLGAQRFKIGATQQLPWKGLLNARKEVAASEAEILAYMDEVKEIDIGYNIRTAYATLLFLEEKKRTVSNKIEILDGLDELAKSAVRSGKGKLSNVLLVERKKEAIEADLNLIEKRKEAPTIMINRWSGRENLDPIDLISQEEQIELPSKYFNYAASDHPNYQVLDSQIKASDKAIALTELERKPAIGVGLEYAFIDGRNDVDFSGNGRDVLMPMGTIRIPLHTDRFDKKKEEEKIRQDAILSHKEDLKKMYSAEVAKALAQIEFYNMEIEKYVGLKTITQETIDLMRSEYATEGTRFEELLRLEMDLIDYDLQIAQSEYNIDLQHAILKKFE